MQESLYKRKKELDRQLSARNHETDGEGRAVVNMTVDDDSNFLSCFSPSKTPIISADVADFIESNTQSIPPNQQLTLRIHGNCIDEHEKVIYKNAIGEYYTERYLANERELKRNRIITLILSLLGILVLALAIFLEYQNDSIIWSEVVDIVAWVLLWEAVDISVFENRSLKLKRMRYMNYISMKVEYYSITADANSYAESIAQPVG